MQSKNVPTQNECSHSMYQRRMNVRCSHSNTKDHHCTKFFYKSAIW